MSVNHHKDMALRPAETFPAAAVGLLIAGLALAALNGAFMKILADALPALLIVWGRNLSYLTLTLPFALARHGAGALLPRRPLLQLGRVLLLLAATMTFIWGVEGLPLGDAVAIVYIYPFVLTALSPMLLKEAVTPAGWVGVIGGFIGVIVVMRPEFGQIDHHALLIFVSGLFVGVHLILTRMVVRTGNPLVTSTYTALVMVAITSLALPFVWQPVSLDQAALLLMFGAVTAASQWLTLVAFARAPAPILAPFSYAEIPSAVVLGLIIFGDLPDALSWVGIAIIITSGVAVARAPWVAQAISRKRSPSA